MLARTPKPQPWVYFVSLQNWEVRGDGVWCLLSTLQTGNKSLQWKQLSKCFTWSHHLAESSPAVSTAHPLVTGHLYLHCVTRFLSYLLQTPMSSTSATFIASALCTKPAQCLRRRQTDRWMGMELTCTDVHLCLHVATWAQGAQYLSLLIPKMPSAR